MSSITISLVVINHLADLQRLLPTLIPAANRVGAEILLLDNMSADGSIEFVKRCYPQIKISENPKRAGYGENHNLNLERASGEYFVVMNTDMTVACDTFSRLHDFINARPDVGIVCPKVLNPDGTVQGLNKRYPTVYDLFLRRCVPMRFQRFFRRRLDYYEMRDVGYEQSCDVEFVSGAFMFCRTEALRRIGGFDQRFFLYFEDADLCRRMQKTHRTMYCRDAEVVHYWRRAAHTRFVYTYIFCCSAARYFVRWGFKVF